MRFPVIFRSNVRLFHKSCGCNQKQEVGVAVGRKGLVQPEVLPVTAVLGATPAPLSPRPLEMADVIDEMHDRGTPVHFDDIDRTETLLEAPEVGVAQTQEMAKQDLDDHLV